MGHSEVMLASRFLLATAFLVGAACASRVQLMGSFKSKDAAVCTLTGAAGSPTAFPLSSGPALITTSFVPFGKDVVTVVPNLAKALASSNVSHVTINFEEETLWPNQAEMLPYSQFGAPAMLLAGGFLVPGKSPGSIDVFVAENAGWKRHKITEDKKGWFYHHAIMVDMDGDGRDDILTARATKPMIGRPGKNICCFLTAPVWPLCLKILMGMGKKNLLPQNSLPSSA